LLQWFFWRLALLLKFPEEYPYVMAILKTQFPVQIDDRDFTSCHHFFAYESTQSWKLKQRQTRKNYQ